MDYIIKLAFVLVVFLYSWLFQIQNQEWDMLRSMLKDAGNIAVHDASQELNGNALSQGRLLIDYTEAYATFHKSLRLNMGLDESLTPLPGSRFHEQVRIIKFEVVDESTGVSFPFLYEDPAYGITKYLQGPAVIAVIETEHPVVIARTKTQGPIRVPAVQEYKLNP
ncbi:hypothetical protein [Paenibacillus tepidiphilus]|uniref:hypothetical protein n=1 Tax=Paenibacillus tepidiphilus TaxID=2608683 RepID=UPI00123B423F|nr:hypothetical protein [Paenibacillus tepidiphilus]